MSFERRASVFTPEALSKIEYAYQLFGAFSAVFDNEYPKYLSGTISFEKLMNLLDPKNLKLIIDDAVKILNENT